jgi:hypothetical protein
MRVHGWVVLAVFSLPFSGSTGGVPSFPDAAPPQRQKAVAESVVRLRIVVDDVFATARGNDLYSFLDEVVAIHNIEWLRVRDERFEIESIRIETGNRTRDASWHLADLAQRTAHERGVLHVKITGQPLEIYSNGTSARPVGGLAYRGADVAVISATRSVPADLAAYYLFHEIGHCWDAFDLPFGGGHSTFGDKRFATFAIDAGNVQIIEDSYGPRPRDTPWLAPAHIRARLATARAATKNPVTYKLLRDLILHEPSRANRDYVAKRKIVLAKAGSDRKAIARVLNRFEITPQVARADDAEARQNFEEQYWIANDALLRGDLDSARAALASIDTHALHNRDARRLVAAAGKRAFRR